MQSASFDIQRQPHGDLVTSTLAGFFKVADVAAYADRVEQAIRACIQRRGHYRMILDVSGCAIQSQDVIAAFIGHVQKMPAARRSAVVVGSSIVRMQIRRVMTRPNVEVFETLADAVAWVDETDARAA